MIKNIIFDWSGVISDDIFLIYKAIMVVFKKFGAEEISFEEFRREYEQPYMIFFHKYLPGLVRIDEEEAFKLAYKELVLENPPKLFFGIKDGLERFKKSGITMIILGSMFREALLREIENFGLQGIFKEFNTDVHDKAEFINDIIKRNNFNPKETIFIGDTTQEVDAGKKGGTLTAAVTWGYQSEEKLRAANPDFLVHNLEELEKIIFAK